MTGKTLVVAVSDTHINSAVALAAPSYTRQDGNEIRANERQLFLWGRWCELARAVAAQRKRGWRTVLLHLGDIAEFDGKGRTYRLMTHDPGEIANLAAQTLEPMTDAVDASVWIKGTCPAHGGMDGIGEADIVAQAEHVIPAEDGTVLREYACLEISGVRFDIAHHAPMGALPWTYQGAAVTLYHRVLHQCAALRVRVPDIILRGHQHRIATAEIDGTYTAYLPGWTYATEHTNRINPGAVGPSARRLSGARTGTTKNEWCELDCLKGEAYHARRYNRVPSRERSHRGAHPWRRERVRGRSENGMVMDQSTRHAEADGPGWPGHRAHGESAEGRDDDGVQAD